MRAEHTPGPWYEGRPDTRTESTVYGKWVYAGEAYLAIVVDDESQDSAVCMSNAKLIAAAPEMLEVCLRSHAYVSGVLDRDGKVGLGSPDRTRIEELRDDLAAAIAKARGENG